MMPYYRVYDGQRGVYFGTGYNAKSMKELIADFNSYIENGDNDEFEKLKTWEQIADYLQEIKLEKSKTKFDNSFMY